MRNGVQGSVLGSSSLFLIVLDVKLQLLVETLRAAEKHLNRMKQLLMQSVCLSVRRDNGVLESTRSKHHDSVSSCVR